MNLYYVQIIMNIHRLHNDLSVIDHIYNWDSIKCLSSASIITVLTCAYIDSMMFGRQKSPNSILLRNDLVTKRHVTVPALCNLIEMETAFKNLGLESHAWDTYIPYGVLVSVPANLCPGRQHVMTSVPGSLLSRWETWILSSELLASVCSKQNYWGYLTRGIFSSRWKTISLSFPFSTSPFQFLYLCIK